MVLVAAAVELMLRVIGAIAIGVAAGVLGGLLGVGGGVLFVPGLVIFVGLTQHQAEATSLLAIVPVAIVGAYSQDRYGNVRRDDAVLMGVLSVAGAAGGVALANALSGALLRDGVRRADPAGRSAARAQDARSTRHDRRGRSGARSGRMTGSDTSNGEIDPYAP